MIKLRVQHTNGAYEIDNVYPQLALLRNLCTLKNLREEYDRLEELRRPFSGRCYDCRCKIEAAEKAYEKAKRSLFGKNKAKALETQLSQLQQEQAAAHADYDEYTAEMALFEADIRLLAKQIGVRNEFPSCKEVDRLRTLIGAENNR